MLRVVTGVNEMSRAKLPWKEMTLYTNPKQVAIQAKLPEFDAQGLVDRPRHRSPEAAEILGLEDATGEEAASGPVRTGGPGAASGQPRASSGAAAGSSRRTGGGGIAGSGAAPAPEDRGKHPRLFIPVPEFPPSPLPGKGGSRDDQASPTGAAEGQGQSEAQRSTPAPKPSVPELSALAGPGLASATAEPGPGPAETGPTDAAAEPEPVDAAAMLEPADATADPELVDTAAMLEPADAAAETETQPPPERLDVNGELQHWEEDIAIRETDTEITAEDLGTQEDLLAHRLSEAAEAAATVAAREARIAKSEAELAAHEQALSVLAGQVKLAAGHAPGTGSAGAVGGQGLEERLRLAKEVGEPPRSHGLACS
ncbi:uncharacterized protein LOC133927580 [Phragmites australis]|uniref:uncharacterized protein LOC133927580 n=1 Tax=Phragmites australis TaxID=29695 RepID=UPI002D792B8D|nr:uncharacterized protein LOC133927580 [Phragmites australis]